MSRRKRAIEKKKKEAERAADPKKAWKASADYKRKDQQLDPANKPPGHGHAVKLWEKKFG